MKKIIIMFCLVALVVTMAIPVFAEETEYSLSGVREFNEVIYPPVYFEFSLDKDISFTYRGIYYTKMQMNIWYNSTSEAYIFNIWGTRTTGGSTVKDVLYGAKFVDGYTDFEVLSNEEWQTDRIFDFGDEPQSIDYDTFDWFEFNSYSLCTGVTCPANDANLDGVCDDCGLMLMRSVVPSLPTGWPDPYSVWTDAKQDTFPYCIMYEDVNGSKLLVMSSTRPYYDADMIVIPDASSGTTYAKYTIYDGNWRLSSSYDDGTEIISAQTYPSFNIFNGDDTLLVIPQATDFFPIPLWMIPSQVTQGQMVAQSVVGTMNILTLCGVGLLASLMAFVLFSKVLPIFHR